MSLDYTESVFPAETTIEMDSNKCSLSSSLTKANLERHSRTLQALDQNRLTAVGPVDLAYPRLSPIRTTKEPFTLVSVPWDDPMMSPVEPSSHDMAFIADDESSFEGGGTLHDDANVSASVPEGFNYEDEQWSPKSDSSDVLTLSPVSTSSSALESRGAESPRTAAKELSIISAISCGLSTLCFGEQSCDHYSGPHDSALEVPFMSCMGTETPPSKIPCDRGFRKRGGGDMSPIRRLASKYPDVFGQPDAPPTKAMAFLPPDSMDMDNRRRGGFGFYSLCA